MTTENIYTQMSEEELDNTFKHLKSAIVASSNKGIGIEGLLEELDKIVAAKTALATSPKFIPVHCTKVKHLITELTTFANEEGRIYFEHVRDGWLDDVRLDVDGDGNIYLGIPARPEHRS